MTVDWIRWLPSILGSLVMACSANAEQPRATQGDAAGGAPAAAGSGGGPSSLPGTGGSLDLPPPPEGGAPPNSSDIPPVIDCVGKCADFPTEPVVHTAPGVAAPPPNAAERFSSPQSGGPETAPCIVDPEPDALFPRNWLRPRIHFSPQPEQDLFEVRVHSDNEANDLVVYTRATSYYLPKEIWEAVTSHVGEPWPLSVSVRGINSNDATAQPSAAAEVSFAIAPSTATGSIVYWTTSGGSALKGFSVGDENVAEIFRPPAVDGECIGCHSSTPDGTFIAVSVSDDGGTGDPTRIALRRGKAPNDEPAFVSEAAKTLLARLYQHIPSFSPAHWSAGDHTMLSTFREQGKTEIVWTDLEATSTDSGVGWGTIARNGDTRHAGGPTWSHDGETIAYCSAPNVGSGANVGNDGDLYTVPYDNRQGGTASPLDGASSPDYNEFYANWSADDRLIAFNRTPRNETSYDNRLSELFVVPREGGSAVRLAANDPPTCSNRMSPGVTNSYPKWSPRAQSIADRTYYWLVFSSRRGGGDPQLYATGIVDSGGSLETHGALYLWNQPEGEGNHTPAWDTFALPPTPPPPIVR